MPVDKQSTLGTIRMDSGVNQEGKPFIRYEWGPMAGQFTPAEACQHARKLMETALGAEYDSIVFEFFTKRIGAEPLAAAQVLLDFRKIRKERGLNDHE